MRNKDYFVSRNGNRYAYLKGERSFHYMPPEENDEKREKKWKLWHETHQMEEKETQFTPTYPVQSLKENLANLRQLLIEVMANCTVTMMLERTRNRRLTT